MRDDDIKQWSIRSVLIKTIYKSGVYTESLLIRTLFRTTTELTPRPPPYTAVRGTRHLSPVTSHSSPMSYYARDEKYEPLYILYDCANFTMTYVRIIIVVI